MNRLCCLVLFVANAALAETPRDFAFGSPLATEGEAALYRVELPAAFYEGAARLDRGDLRVFNADGALVPFGYLPAPDPGREKGLPVGLPGFPLRVEAGEADLNGLALSVSRTAAGTVLNLTTRDGRPVAGERLVGYVFDASALEEPISALTLGWQPQPQGFTARARLEASDDLAHWRLVASDAPLIDLTYQGRHLKRDRIEFVSTKAKYLRLTWSSAQPIPEPLAAQFEVGEKMVDTPRRWIQITGTPVRDHEGEYEFDLRGVFPADRIAIDLPEVNSVVPAQLYARATTQEPWQAVAAAVLYRLRQADAEITPPATSVNAGEQRYWLLRVDPNSGGLGSGQPRLRAGWLPQEIVFAARGAAPFTIAYGSPTAIPSALPISTIVPGYGTASAPSIGTATAQAGKPATLGGIERLRKPIDTKRLLLWGTLVLGVALLGWMAWRLSRQLGAASADRAPEQRQGPG